MAIQAQIYPDNLGIPLYTSPDWIMENNFTTFNDFNFNLQRPQNLHYLKNMNCTTRAAAASTANATPTATASGAAGEIWSMGLCQSIAGHVEKQRQEIDRCITLQNERLKLALQEQRKQQIAAIIRKVESKAMLIIRQKDEEISKAKRRRIELESFMRRIEVENQAWQRIAAENEAIAVSLKNTIDELKEKNASNNEADDAESCCEVEEKHENEEKNEELMRENEGKLVCKGCKRRNSCVLFLPCRHLCSCKACESCFDSCPVCKSVKKESIEALIS